MNLSQATIAFSLGSLLTITTISVSKAGQFPDGRVFFDNSPVLIDAYTTFTAIRMWGAKYYFSLSVPESVGVPLKRIDIQQRQGPDNIDYNLDQTIVFEGTWDNQGQSFTVKETTINEDTQTITVIIDPPIPPGTNFTVGLIPVRNPDIPGTYSFGVTVYPTDAQSNGLSLGVRDLDFFAGGGRSR